MTPAVAAGRSGSSPGRPAAGDRGQATVELVLVVPVVVLLALVLVQVGQVVHHQLLVAHAAREAARAAAVSGGRLDAGSVPGLTGGLDPARLDVDVVVEPGGAGERVRARVTYREPTDVALVGPMVPDVGLSAEVVMHLEG